MEPSWVGLHPPKVLKSQPQTRDCHLVFRGCDSDEVMRVGGARNTVSAGKGTPGQRGAAGMCHVKPRETPPQPRTLRSGGAWSSPPGDTGTAELCDSASLGAVLFRQPPPAHTASSLNLGNNWSWRDDSELRQKCPQQKPASAVGSPRSPHSWCKSVSGSGC